jgi:hypothetical protein
MLTGMATGTGGISHIQQVYGSGQGDVLVGDGTGILLAETSGKNLIIGGTGGDNTLMSGSGQDIVIAGSTIDDSDQTVLLGIESLSNRSKSLDQLVNLLSNVLNGATVEHHDGAGDTITLGSANDWLFWRTMGAGEDALTENSQAPGYSTYL